MTQKSPYAAAASNISFGRLLNSATWLSAFQMPLRLHIWTDGVLVRTAIHFHGKWSRGLDLDYQETRNGAVLASYVQEFASQGYERKKCNGIGVILHVADEMAACPLHDEFLQEKELNYAQIAILTEPHIIVDDTAAPEDHVWRVLPASREQTMAIRLPVDRGRVLASIRSAVEALPNRVRLRVPVRVAMVSSPIASLAALPIYYLPDNLNPPRTHIICFAYQRYTTIAVIDGGGDLVDFNVLSHGVRSSPQGFAQRAHNHMAKYGIETDRRVNLTLVQMGNVSLQPLVDDLTIQASSAQDIFHDARIELIAAEELKEITKKHNLPGEDWFCAEFAAYDMPLQEAENSYLCLPTRRKLRGAAEANFYTQQIMADKSAFTSGEAWAYVMLGAWNIAAFIGLFMAILAGVASVAFSMREPAWNLPPDKAAEVEQVRRKIAVSTAALERWEDIARPRSHAWEAMEFLHKLIPDSEPVVLKKVTLSLKGGPPANPADSNPEKIGFVRNWSLEGLASADWSAGVEAEAVVAAYQSVAAEGESTYLLNDRRLKMDVKQERVSGEAVNGKYLDIKWKASLSDSIDGAAGFALPLRALNFPDLDEATIDSWSNLKKASNL